MKSSTIRRSNLSKEKIAVLEALSKFNGSDNSGRDSINDTGINNEPIEDGAPEVYVRQNKEKELDLLWKDFKMPRGERSPIVYLGIGFVSGIIATLIVSAFIGVSSGKFHPGLGTKAASEAVVVTPAENSEETEIIEDETAENSVQRDNTQKPSKKFGLFGSAKSNAETEESSVTAKETKEYEVQSGDTMEKIVRNFYGSYSEESVNTVMKANNMSNPNKLSIGQKLIIPLQ